MGLDLLYKICFKDLFIIFNINIVNFILSYRIIIQSILWFENYNVIFKCHLELL